MTLVVANIIGPELLVVLGVVTLLFGSSQLPKLARSLGSAKTEFEKAQREGKATSDDKRLPSGEDDATP